MIGKLSAKYYLCWPAWFLSIVQLYQIRSYNLNMNTCSSQVRPDLATFLAHWLRGGQARIWLVRVNLPHCTAMKKCNIDIHLTRHIKFNTFPSTLCLVLDKSSGWHAIEAYILCGHIWKHRAFKELRTSNSKLRTSNYIHPSGQVDTCLDLDLIKLWLWTITFMSFCNFPHKCIFFKYD